ncbi:hypothetical protein FOBRF1_012968 [Fusarium oxysporum]
MTVSTILVIGGTGAQGMPVVRGFVFDGRYAVKVLARDTQSPRAQILASISPKVEILEGAFTSEVNLINGLQGSQGSFLNIDSFTIGEKAKMVAFYNMTMATFTMGTYIKMAISGGNPMAPQVVIQKGEEVVIWRVPLTQPGAVVHVSLEGCAYSWHWLFDHKRQLTFGINLRQIEGYKYPNPSSPVAPDSSSNIQQTPPNIMESNSPFEKLPAELITIILSTTNSPADIQSIIRADPYIWRVFLHFKHSILRPFMQDLVSQYTRPYLTHLAMACCLRAIERKFYAQSRDQVEKVPCLKFITCIARRTFL